MMNSFDLQTRLTAALKGLLTEEACAPEYTHKWKDWPALTGPSFPGLRAKARRAASGGFGWPSPMAGSPATESYNEAGNTDSSRRTVELIGWNTPRATDGDKGGPNQAGGALPTDLAQMEARRAKCKERTGNGNGFGMTLGQAIPLMMAGWATPACRDYRDGRASKETMERNSRPLNEQVMMLASGQTSTSSPARMESPGVLNAEFVRWLQGYPAEWLSCVDWVTLSSRKSRQNSSAPSSKQRQKAKR